MSRYDGNNQKDNMPMFAHVTVGILIATLIITTSGGVLIYLNAKAEERQMILVTAELNRPAREAAIEREKERQTAIAIAEANARATIEAQRVARIANEEKLIDQADFKRWYKKPERCEIMTDHGTRVFCANSYMQARAKWEKIRGKAY